MGGAGIFGTAYWLSNKARQQVWVSGMEALVCTKKVYEPLSISGYPTQRLRDLLQGTGNVLGGTFGQLVESVRDAQLRAEAAKRNVGSPPDQQKRLEYQEYYEALGDAELVIDAATKLTNSATTNQGKATLLLATLSRAGQSMMNSIDAVTAEVDKQVLAVQPDFASLTAILGSLSGYYENFKKYAPAPAPAPAPKKAETPPKTVAAVRDPIDILNSAVSALRSEMDKLKERNDEIISYLSAFGEIDPRINFGEQVASSCKVREGAILALSPDEPLKVKKNVPSKRPYQIVGGVSPYSAEVAEGEEPAPLKVNVEAATQNLVVDWKGDGKAKLASYTVVVRDKAGHVFHVPVEVQAN